MLYITVLCIILAGLLCACENQKDYVESPEKTVTSSSKKEIADQIISTGEAIVGIASDVVNKYNNTD